MPKPISTNSTVASVWPKLTHPREYVAGVRHKAMLCQKQHGDAHVRIGVTGTGQKPCYRVFYQGEAGEAIFGSYWDTHEPLENETALNTNWSISSMTFDEVDAFLKDKINWKPKT